MGQLDNGSYVKTFWAGLLADYTWTWGRFAPYLGVTVGGGTTTDFLRFEGSKKDWAAEPEAYFHKEPFVTIDPFIGCDYIVSSKLHLTLKLDYLNGIGGKELPPHRAKSLYRIYLLSLRGKHKERDIKKHPADSSTERLSPLDCLYLYIIRISLIVNQYHTVVDKCIRSKILVICTCFYKVKGLSLQCVKIRAPLRKI